jgi:hypothetical protein
MIDETTATGTVMRWTGIPYLDQTAGTGDDHLLRVE